MPIKHPNPKLAQQEHYYRTPPHVTQALLDRETFINAPLQIWEPACGDGAMAKVISDNNYDCIATELMDRGYGETDRDFLKERQLLAPSIVTNPPFKLADEFVRHGFALGAEKICILQRLAWLEGGKRHDELWTKWPLARVWVFSARQTLWRGDDPDAKAKGGAVPFAWFVFDLEHQGDPILKWIR